MVSLFVFCFVSFFFMSIKLAVGIENCAYRINYRFMIIILFLQTHPSFKFTSPKSPISFCFLFFSSSSSSPPPPTSSSPPTPPPSDSLVYKMSIILDIFKLQPQNLIAAYFLLFILIPFCNVLPYQFFARVINVIK